MRQIIEVQLSETNPSPNINFTIDVIYSTADPVDETLSGLGLRLHYNSSALTFDLESGLSRNEEIPSFLLPPGGAPAEIEENTDDLDNDRATDKILSLSWFNLNGN